MSAKVTVKTSLFIVLISLCLLAGCSTVPNTSGVAGSHVESADANQKMAKVNRRNSVRGIDTLWINPPRNKPEDSDDNS